MTYLQAVVDRVGAGFGDCNRGWAPILVEQSHSDAWPSEVTARFDNGDVVAHWGTPPADGAACWMYREYSGRWEAW